jgi:hypothetical protein
MRKVVRLEMSNGFRKGRGCVDQVFVLKYMCVCVCKKYSKKQKDLFVAFMDLVEAFDRVDSMAMWQVLKMCGVGAKILGR